MSAFLAAAVAGQSPTASAAAPFTAADWRPLPDLPDPIGFGGPIVGVHSGVLIVAGGANFPGDPPWSVDGRPPGTKVWHERIYALEPPDSTTPDAPPPTWVESGRLPDPLAYAAAVSTPEGVYVLGGETFRPPARDATPTNHPARDVWLLRWNAARRQVEVLENALPPLPQPCQYHAAALHDRVLYVVASQAASASSRQLDDKAMWRLDLAQPAAERAWKALPPWPGPPREKMALVVQLGPGEAPGSRRSQLFLIGGSTWARHADGAPDDARATHFSDGYRFDPATERWDRIAELPSLPEPREIDTSGYSWDGALPGWRKTPDAGSLTPDALRALFDHGARPLGAAPAIEVGDDRVLIFSGATGRYVTMDVQHRPPFPTDVVAYNTRSGEWSLAGVMPIGVVTTSAVWWNGGVVIPSGEVRPGVRTRAVQWLPLPGGPSPP